MTNRLADETSPYLRQHADNPVEWYPWGQEAFDAARAAERPILLSIGYSACHWCHVMAHESFENEDTAAVMNKLFVNVKVDREERPDVDAIYMEVVTALTGHGGWPMTVFLTPDGEAFFGGTYFPPTRRGGMPSFLDVCAAIDDAWTNRRDEVTEQATHITEALTEAAATEAGDLPTTDTFDAAFTQMRQQYDERWGGFGSAPKFPQAMGLELLLRRPGPAADHLPMVTNCLDAMASGGIYDHLGGGFARYSVDEEWLVPHFEKMLYDNALLARVYLHAWQLTGEPRFRQVLDETIGYVLADLAHPGGGFYSAEDADSEGEEGKFYVWTEAQIRAVLGNGPDTDAALAWWGVDQGPNFEHGTNILHRPVRGDLIRPGNVEAARIGLLAARGARIRPGLDDKVLTEWNGLFLASLAEAARVTGDPTWREAAVRNGEFLLAHLRRDDGRWLRSWQADGGARHLAYAVDYGALLDAFVRLAELTGEARWIAEARSVAEGLLALFWDDEHGGVFTTGSDADALITRPKDVSDNATPSANALAAFGLLRLSALTGDDGHRERAGAILRLLTPLASRNALFFAHGLVAADLWSHGSTEIVVVGDRSDLLAEINRRYLPRAVLAWGEPYDSPLWADRAEGRAYVCEGFTCKLPATTAEELAAQLG